MKDDIRNFNHADKVNHPLHYNTGKIEVIEMIEDQALGYHLGCAVKYIMRAGKKDPAKEIEDLEKALWYIRRHVEVISQLEPRRPNEMPQERYERRPAALPPSGAGR